MKVVLMDGKALRWGDKRAVMRGFCWADLMVV